MASRVSRRPRFAALVAPVLVLGLLGALTACSSTAESKAGAAPNTSEPGYKITVAGDSISIGLGAELRNVVGADKVVKVIGEEGTGLARPDRFDWPTRLQTLARDFPPTVLVLSLSSNDGQNLTNVNDKLIASIDDTAAWEAEYARRLGASFDAFAGTGTTVIWVGHVRTADDKVGLVNRRIQKIATTVAATRPFVKVQDLAELLGTGETKATRCLQPDGLHLTVPCLDEAAGKLQAQLPPSA